MKNKLLLIITIVFFVLINTSYYWEGKLELFAFPIFTFLVVIYLVLAVALFRQIYLATKERFSDKKRVVLVAILTTVLSFTFFRPAGIIDFDKFEGSDVLIAQREGSANCLTTFKFKKNYKFIEKNVCFGVTENKGTYKFVNDTIYFENITLDRQGNKFYKYAVIRPSVFIKDNKHFDLISYKDMSDTTGFELLITKNELSNLTDIKTNR